MSGKWKAVAVAALATALMPATAEGHRTPSVHATRILSGPYLGSYTARLTLAEAASRGDSRLAGRFALVLRKNGTYTTSTSLDGMSRGRLTALPRQRLRFSNDSGCAYGGFERPQGGVYRWSVRGRRLTLRLVTEGACTGRTQTLTYPVWHRK